LLVAIVSNPRTTEAEANEAPPYLLFSSLLVAEKGGGKAPRAVRRACLTLNPLIGPSTLFSPAAK